MDTYTCMITHFYGYMRAHPIYSSTSERLGWLDFEILEVGHQECFVVDGNIVSY
jgi:hypothetical protein